MSAASTLPHGCVPRRCWFNFHAQRHLALQLPSTHHSSFALFLFFVTKSRIFGPNTSGVENTPNFLSFNVIRNPALHWTVEHWTLDIGRWTFCAWHWTLDMRHWRWDNGHEPLALDIGHWQPTPAGRLLPPPWPPAGRQATSLCSCCSACNNHSNLLECSTTLAQPLHNLSALFAQPLNVLCESFSPWK